ncbi:hypothetical protein [Limnochorda pilosa]|uniref:hypothetical protein n=1 Tax=Limnochorda pilosa TaxID=1555112 RepID=UPI00130D82F8|nr:hypothetical protein [Limnochorda pilosa]
MDLEAGLFLVRSSPRSYPLSDEALAERVAAALEAGARAAATLRRRRPEATAEELARELGVPVTESTSSGSATGASRVRLADFLAGRGIVVYREGLERVAAALREMLPDEREIDVVARELLVAHELFHALSHLRPGGELPALPRVSRQLGYTARFLGIPFRAAIPELEEVAAHGFSTAWTRLAVPALLVHAHVAARYDPRWAEWGRPHGPGQ